MRNTYPCENLRPADICKKQPTDQPRNISVTEFLQLEWEDWYEHGVYQQVSGDTYQTQSKIVKIQKFCAVHTKCNNLGK